MKIIVRGAPEHCKDCMFNRDGNWPHCILLDASTEFTDKWGHDLGYGKLEECPLEEEVRQ